MRDWGAGLGTWGGIGAWEPSGALVPLSQTRTPVDSYARGFAADHDLFLEMNARVLSRVPYMLNLGCVLPSDCWRDAARERNVHRDVKRMDVSIRRVAHLSHARNRNHEADDPNGPTWLKGTDGGGECGVPTLRLYPMPSLTAMTPWYSVVMGPVFAVQFSTEWDFTTGSPQWSFIRDALASVDRAVTPWVRATGGGLRTQRRGHEYYMATGAARCGH